VRDLRDYYTKGGAYLGVDEIAEALWDMSDGDFDRADPRAVRIRYRLLLMGVKAL